jgi:hypothetical protein
MILRKTKCKGMGVKLIGINLCLGVWQIIMIKFPDSLNSVLDRHYSPFGKCEWREWRAAGPPVGRYLGLILKLSITAKGLKFSRF